MACCKGSQSVIRGLLENGAEVHTGIFAETYKLLLKLKSNNAKLAPGLTSLKGYNRQWVRDGSKQTKETLRLPDQNEASTINSCSFPLEFWRSKRIYPIELASANHQIDTVKLLLQKYDQKTILNLSFCFLINPSLETACAFLKAGAKIELQVDPKGSNPLHVAARTGKLGLVIAYLTFCKTDINYRGENNWTALHEATSLKHMAVVQYLIKSGADASLLTKDGLTAHQIAVEVGIEGELLNDYFGIFN